MCPFFLGRYVSTWGSRQFLKYLQMQNTIPIYVASSIAFYSLNKWIQPVIFWVLSSNLVYSQKLLQNELKYEIKTW